ncbi:MAG TPA: SDR family NAD(P)-dependent oxidoreductase, partial [Candidatus Atribacteria bacterium]|nr:SDR family NAD(P)-dependent oxidoreductase [Candidatus Atribacteria bacterium]
MKFQGKVILITGAARGVGKVITKWFAQEGATVIINDIDLQEGEKVAQQINQEGFKAFVIKADVSKSAEVEAMIHKVINTYG